MINENLKELINSLVKYSTENEYLEFKHNFHSAEEIGERISALSNGACIQNQPCAYLVFGVENDTHQMIGTTFRAKSHRKGNEDLEHWLTTRLNPRIEFTVHEFDYDNDRHISLFVISAAKTRPVEFMHNAYIRVGSITRKLNEFPEKQAKIWKKQSIPFEKEIAKDNLSGQDVVNLLSTETYFNLLKLPYPSTQHGVLEKFSEEGLIIKNNAYAITNLGALLFAKNMRDFESVERKSVRVIVYKGTSKIETIREQTVAYGYAIGFIGLIDWINGQLPANEEIVKALRKETRMYPEIAIRELVANALIHQDLTEKGFPMIEIFSDRVEISNAGTPLVSPERFIDAYRSRNDKLADMMRRMGFCEEKGSGMDKVISQNELYQLPPINIIVAEQQTRVTMYSYKPLKDLSKREKIRACYQHACLKYVSNYKMTNQTLRERFKIENQNAAIASRIIRDALAEKIIKEEDSENKSKKYASYLPFWA
jgi:predicted HTH transcriptional regulator